MKDCLGVQHLCTTLPALTMPAKAESRRRRAHALSTVRTAAWASIAALALSGVAGVAHGQDGPLLLRDLQSQNAKMLSREELQRLLPGAKMGRVSGSGNTHLWTNESDGTFVISSDNRATNTRPTTAAGKWHISEDGRYCVLIDWRRVDSEEWCRYIFQTTEGYYGVKSDRVGTERAHRLEIKK